MYAFLKTWTRQTCSFMRWIMMFIGRTTNNWTQDVGIMAPPHMDAVPFNEILIWISDLRYHHAITVPICNIVLMMISVNINIYGTISKNANSAWPKSTQFWMFLGYISVSCLKLFLPCNLTLTPGSIKSLITGLCVAIMNNLLPWWLKKTGYGVNNTLLAR